MTKIILGILISAGILFTVLAYIENAERKKEAEWDKYEERRKP